MQSLGAAYEDLQSELSGDASDADIAGELGLDQMGFASLGDDELGAIIRKAVSKGIPAKRVASVIQRSAAASAIARRSGFGLLSEDPGTPEGAFGVKGSLNLLSFTGTVNQGSTLTVSSQLDRRSTIRELRAEGSSTPLRVVSFSAAGLPFGALRFPFSLASFGPNVQDRKIRPQTYDGSVTFNLVVSNPTGAPIDMLLEAWGTPGE
jgi:hypothetical protein